MGYGMNNQENTQIVADNTWDDCVVASKTIRVHPNSGISWVLGSMALTSSTCIIISRRIFFIFNLGIPFFLGYTAVMGLLHLKSYTSASTTTVFQAVYMLLFAALLFIYEAVQICPCGPIDNILKRNFGFFYGVLGKGASKY